MDVARDMAVWRRVTAGREPAPVPGATLSLTELLRRESEHAVAYGALARQYGMPRRRQFQLLAKQASQQCHILEGLIKNTPHR